MKRSILGLSFALLAPLSLQADPPQANEVFNKLDSNKDGVLSESEIPADRKRFLGRVLEKGDTNKDGKLTADEFAVAFKPPQRDGEKGERPARPEGARRGGDGEFFNRMDKNQDGKITKDEIAGLPEQVKARVGAMLEKADKDGDGVTKEELAAAFKARAGAPGAAGRPEGKPGDFAEAMFKRMDANGDGKVELSEVPEQGKERFERMLKGADTNGDKAITKEEFLAGMKKLREARPQGGNPGDFMKRIIERMDTDKDGAISAEEAQGRLKENFDKIDGNKDGKITAEEMAAGFKRAAEGRPKRPEGKKPEGKKPEKKPESN